jgi:hypothetical protein
MQKALRVATLLAATAALAAPSEALAYSYGGGNSANAPGQANAHANCHNAYVNQAARGVQAGGGPKSAETGPLNCDHYWQGNGAIGGGGG